MEASSPPPLMSSPMGEILTPRTKVARMLAEIDNEIDNAPTPSPTKVAALDIQQPARTPPESSGSPGHELAYDDASAHATFQSASDADEDDDAIRKPQGRAARRMLQVQNGPSLSAAESPDHESFNTQRMDTADESDDEDLYSATPKKTRDRARSDSPSPRGSDNAGGLFVSPARSAGAESEDELPSNPFGGKDKLAELVAQKKAERLAREAKEQERKKQSSKAHHSSELSEELFEDSQEPVDAGIERIMSDATRPSRKASKKALLEMERETQRLARQQALAHQMKVKKEFTTSDLFARFNFRPADTVSGVPAKEGTTEGETSASSAPNSDGVEEIPKEPVSTPPSSPPTPLDRQKELVDIGALSKLVASVQDGVSGLVGYNDDDQELPDIADVLSSSQVPRQRTKDAVEVVPGALKSLKLARLGKQNAPRRDSDSDDDLDVVPNLPAHLRVLERATGSKRGGRAADSKAVHNLKHLAQLHGDDAPRRKKGTRISINAQALDLQLRSKAKEQARKEQLERIEELKAKGIDVQTIEDREKEAEAFEDLLEKARQDAVKLRKAEKAAKDNARDEGVMQASEDEDEDEDYAEDDDESDSETELTPDHHGALVDDAAEETDEDDEEVEGSDEEQAVDDASMADDDAAISETASAIGDLNRGPLETPAAPSRKPRVSRVVVDDEDEEDVADEEDVYLTAQAEDPFAAFNFGAAANADTLFSPTQAFNATMQTPTQLTQEDSFDILRHIAPPSLASLPPSLPDLDTQTQRPPQSSAAEESQVPESQRVNLEWETQPPETPLATHLHRGPSVLSETPGWEPSPDPGLPSPWGVQLRRDETLDSLPEHETQSTVRLRVSESPAASHAAVRRGRLMRKQVAIPSDSDEEVVAPSSVRLEKKDAFREMRRRRKEALTAAERAEAAKEMRGMMDEQAEESEDEYAGLGGDDYIAPETEQDKEMIDSSEIEVDERALAAHFAERQRASDEAEIGRLYKDATTGGFRKRAGANAFDLEEDEDELAARRRQMRQQEEARKRRALLKDVNVASLAEGRQSKGKDAFLRAIADDDGEDDVVNVSQGEEHAAATAQEDSQASQSQDASRGPLRESSGNKRRISTEDKLDITRGRPPKQQRMELSTFRRPTSLLEVQESVSLLLEEPNASTTSSHTAPEPASSDVEDESAEGAASDENDDDYLMAAESARDNDGGFAPNPAFMKAKSAAPPSVPALQRRSASKSDVVDRLSLRRSASNSESAHSRTAWAAGPATGGFKVPSLLRRATTNVASGANERGVTTPALSRENSGVKMGGTKKSSLAYQARAEERRAIVEASAKRREENTARIAQLRRNSSALNRGLTGRFE